MHIYECKLPSIIATTSARSFIAKHWSDFQQHNMALPALLSNSDTSSVRTLSRALLGLLISSIGHLLHVKFRPGLRRIPGPWLASISSLDRLRSAASGQQMNYHLELHERYGPLVRIGPNHVSFAYADLIPEVYGVGTKFRKVSLLLWSRVRELWKDIERVKVSSRG